MKFPQAVDSGCLGHCRTGWNATYLTYFSYYEGQKWGKLTFQTPVIWAKFMTKSISVKGSKKTVQIRLCNVQKSLINGAN